MQILLATHKRTLFNKSKWSKGIFKEEKPKLTKRELAQIFGTSIGGVNYCLKAVIYISQIKDGSFKKNPEKFLYIYLVTPKG